MKSSSYVTINDIEFTCDYDYIPAWSGHDRMVKPEPEGIENLTVEFDGLDFTELLKESVLETIEQRILERGEPDEMDLARDELVRRGEAE